MIAFADILAKNRSDPEDGWIKLIFFGIFALIWIISGVASALAKKKAKLPRVPQPWQPSPLAPQPTTTPAPVAQPRARQEIRPKLKTQVRKPARGPAMPPPLPQARAELPPVEEVAASISNTAALLGTTGPAPMTRVRRLVGNDLRRAVLMSEVLGTPVSLR